MNSLKNLTAFAQGGSELSPAGRYVVLAAGFLGWMFAGLEMSTFPLVVRPATLDFLGSTDEAEVGKWFARYTSAFLLAAAGGGLLFGWAGDRIGRVRAMALSIACYSCFTGLSYFAQSPEHLIALRFLASLGIGGTWPSAVSLVSEAWSDVSRPYLAGLLGASANIGFVLMSLIAYLVPITPQAWRWVMLVGAAPVFLAGFVWLGVPESPRWLADRRRRARVTSAPLATVFSPPLLKRTIIGICLGAVPLLGGWGTLNWLTPWADKVGGAADPQAKAVVSMLRSSGSALGCLLGAWLANLVGRRLTYFLISLATTLVSGYIFRFLTPADSSFLFWSFVVGFVGVTYFGWLPLYLPELFPTRARATGAGVSFNFGRVATAIGVLGTGLLMSYYEGEYARVGRVTSLVYALGLIIIWWGPETKGKPLED